MLAHAAVVTRSLRYGGQVLNTGYVEGVAVRNDQQGRGLGRIVMDHAETVIRTRHQIGALNAVENAGPFYAQRGWWRWEGPTRADTPHGNVDTFDPTDHIFVFTPHPTLIGSSTEPLVCDWRADAMGHTVLRRPDRPSHG